MSTPTPTASPIRVRATTADRDHVASLIQTSMDDGALNAEEGAERMGAVRQAVYRDEFAALLADLPLAQAPAMSDDRHRAGLGGYVRTHRNLSIVLAVILAVLVLAGAVAAGVELAGGHHGGHRDFGQEHARMYERNGR